MGQETVFHLPTYLRSAIAQGVIRRLPNKAARVRAQITSCGVCGKESGTGVGFLRALPFSYQFVLRLFHAHHLSSGAVAIGQLVAALPSVSLSLTLPNGTKEKTRLSAYESKANC
jgi:hypothetical protein